MLSEEEKAGIEKMIERVPTHIESIVIESNISTREDMEFVARMKLKDPRVNACLVGASILAADHPRDKITELMGRPSKETVNA